MFVRSPIITKFVSSVIANGSSPLKRVTGSGLGQDARRDAVDRGGDLANVVGRRAAAAADDVDEPVACELAEHAARVVRLLVVQAELVRQAGVRIAGDPRRRDPRHVLDERPHLRRAERAVDADDQRPRVLDREPERLDRLSREVAAALVDRREREPERQLGRLGERRGDRGLRVQRVEDRLDEQDVDAAVAQRADLVRVRVAHLVEGDRAVRRVVDPRRERERHVERADRAGDEPRLVGRLRRPGVRGAPREPRALEVHLAHDVGAERVVRLPDRRRGERVRRRDVGAGGEVVVVDPRDDLGPRDVQEVGVAGDVVRVVAEPLAAVRLLPAQLALDEDAPGAVEDGDPFAEDAFEALTRFRHSLLPSSQPGSAEPRSRAL